MSNIVIVVTEVPSPKTLLLLQKMTGLTLSEIRARAMDGRPVWEEDIFDEQYDEKAALLRQFLGLCETGMIHCCFYELPEGETLASSTSADQHQVTSEILTNILDSADAELDRQLGMGE